jgi:aspartyl-tRNA(Asn)/glutamyl-tRNA(Gln) amidotransferase subunit C
MHAEIDEVEVRHIARLARLKLSDAEARLFAGQLGRILEYVKQIESLDTEGVEPLAHALAVTNVLREDDPRPGLTSAQALANAPETERGCFRVPAVLDRPADAQP